MKCDTLLVVKPLKKGRKILQWLTPFHRIVNKFPTSNLVGTLTFNRHLPEFREEDLERCDGNIIATVKAVDEPDYHSDHYAMLAIEYKCDKCGCPFVGELPQDADQLSEFLTSAIAAVSEEQRAEWLTAHKKRKEEHDAAVARSLAQLQGKK